VSGNIEVVQEIYAAFDRRAWDEVKVRLAPDVEWHQFTALPDRATFRGRDEVIGTFLVGQWIDQFPDIVVHVDEMIEAGDNVVAIGTAEGRGRESGIEIRLRFAHFWRLAGGEVIEVRDVAGEPRPLRA
jgi:uncharacterized protein